MKKILNIVKKVIFALSIIYGFNMLMNPIMMFIPLNIVTIITVATLGFPGLLVIVGISVFI